MEITVTNLTIDDITRAIRNELRSYFEQQEEKEREDEIGGIELAIELTRLAKPTIYSLVWARKIPHQKKGIRDDGSTVKEREIADRAIKATKVLEKEFGLKQVEYIKSSDRRLKIGEYKLMERTNQLSVLAEAKLTIDEILKEEPTVQDFVECFQQFGFEVRPNISEKTGKMNGFSYKKDEITFKSSTIAKNYSWKNLQKNGLKYDQTRDSEYLIGVKNEFTQKLNIESRGDRAIETAKPAIDPTESVTDRMQSITSRAESSLKKSNQFLDKNLTEIIKRLSIEILNIRISACVFQRRRRN